MDINILGEKYSIKYRRQQDDPKLESREGYCDFFSKEIVIEDMQPDEDSTDNIEACMRKVLRHEIIHAFLFESGLHCNTEWADNEEMVDWMAIQIPKIAHAIKFAEGFYNTRK